MAGLVALFVALASPLDVLADRSLAVHMAQHLVLLVVVPPLVLAGAPLAPLLLGMPRGAIRRTAGRLAARSGAWLRRPLVGLVALSLATWGWHVPAAFELALRSRAWHVAEHASFVAAGLLFWWPVVRPWPWRGAWPAWVTVPYLLVADVQNTALAAILVFAGRAFYPSYGTGPDALDGQVVAGVLMWVPMSLAYLVPAAVLTVRWLSPGGAPGQRAASRPAAAGSSRNSARRPARAARATGSAESGDSIASRTTSAFSAPKAAVQTSDAPVMGTSVSVSRRGGGFGESTTATTGRLDSSRAR
jgi:cytochrome c oxidase assembly factor CtaG